MGFTHLNSAGDARMVDVGAKAETAREARARGKITLGAECMELIASSKIPKGDVFAAARIAGISAAKKCSDLIPLCHNIALTGVDIAVNLAHDGAEVVCTAKTFGRTGVEMEALTGVSAALLTVWDMCKAIDKHMEIGGIALEYKTK